MNPREKKAMHLKELYAAEEAKKLAATSKKEVKVEKVAKEVKTEKK